MKISENKKPERIKLGLLGKSIQHSKSQEMYEKIYNKKIDYYLFDYPMKEKIPEIDSLFEIVDGLSITSPYKNHFLEDVIIENEIKKLKAINCIKKEDGKFYGTNTDYLAIDEIISDWKLWEYEVFILGNGAMAFITNELLKKNEITTKSFYRKKDGDISQLNFNRIRRTKKKTCIINTCSRDFVFKGEMPVNTRFWDYNYSYPIHKESLDKKCEYIDGMTLLYNQAVHSRRFW